MDKEVSEISVPVPWGEIRGKVWGPKQGRPVLCLHGWADNCGTFNTLIPLLPKECRYVAVDLAGHGLSSHRPTGAFYAFPENVADIRRVVDGLQWTRFSIIGHSMGGNIAGMFSSLYPEMVDAVVLLDCFGFLPADLPEITQAMRQGIDDMLQFEKKTEKKRVYTYEKAVERWLAANPSMSEQSVHILLERGLVQVEGGFVFSRDIRINFKNIERINLEQSLEMQSRIQAPVLIVLGDEGFGGKLFTESHRRESYVKVLQGYHDKNHSVVSVPGDHHVHLNDPEVVAPLVSDFLQTKVISQQLPA
ncbi:serine hydrolase-like protein isoform X3 [Centropristis striata]|uniref:serine hydrolase-like protein isoform X3 n=1 Tax=Centropristis striata TaxID=184440 RepID=UPI0027DEB427|nr:serine hydrolase-like protein isoform X3 [Centropristis striata]